MKKILYLILLTSLISACSSVKYAGKKSAKKYYEEFFIDQGVMQYFIKPVEYKNGKNKITVDFTFRDSVPDNGNITLNFSLFSENLVKKIDSASFISSNQEIKIKNLKRMFIDKRKNIFQVRYTSSIKFRDMSEIFANNYNLILFYNKTKQTFVPKTKTLKIYRAFDNKVLSIIELNRE